MDSWHAAKHSSSRRLVSTSPHCLKAKWVALGVQVSKEISGLKWYHQNPQALMQAQQRS